MWVVSGRFTICGYETPEVNLTPLLGVGVLIGISIVLLYNTSWG